VVDTRGPAGRFGGPPLVGGQSRTFVLRGACDITATAKAVAVNITVTQPTNAGDLRVFPAGTGLPLVSSINYSPGHALEGGIVINQRTPGSSTAPSLAKVPRDGPCGALIARTIALSLLVLSVPSWSEGQAFTDAGVNLVGVSASSVAWGDYDGDGDLDILLTGWTGSSRVSLVYRNEGLAAFTDIGAGLTPVNDGAVAWGDHDNDGDLDILLTGDTGSGLISKVYRNDGGGTFTDTGAGLVGVSSSAVAWGDYDRDGDLDILLTGRQATFSYLARVYRNDGGGSFTDIVAGLTPVFDGAAAWGDHDKDGDLDIFLSGDTGQASSVARVYRNNGDGSFTGALNFGGGVKSSSMAWGDYDNDGDLDIFYAGREPNVTGPGGDQLELCIWSNGGTGTAFNGTCSFTAGVEQASVALGDYDNDGDLDLVLTGLGAFDVSARVYRNDAGTFTDINAALAGAGGSSTAWGDYDNDGDLDILVTGYTLSGGSQWIARLYRNNAPVPNSSPSAPVGLAASVASGQVGLAWAAATDAQTPTAGLSYNLRVGTTPGGSEVSSPLASAATGHRHVPAMGNVQLGSTATLKGLAVGTYYWSVQAIDAALAGSLFAVEGSFSVGTATPTGQKFYTLTPCRIVDTRDPDGPLGGPSLQPGTQRNFALAGPKCGVPPSAVALSINVTVTGPTAPGNLRLFPAGVAPPLVSTVNFGPGQTRANSAVVKLGSGGTGSIGVQNDATGTAQFIVDVNGYFE
jgi:hypothetical protein